MRDLPFKQKFSLRRFPQMKKQLSFLTKYFSTNVENSASRASRFETFIFEAEVVGDMSLVLAAGVFGDRSSCADANV